MYTENQIHLEISNFSEPVKQALKDGEPIMVIVGGVCFRYFVKNYSVY